MPGGHPLPFRSPTAEEPQAGQSAMADPRARVEPEATAKPSTAGRPLRVPRGLVYSAAVYLITRVPILVALVVYLHSHPGQSLSRIVTRRDGGWYLRLATEGYSHSLRTPVSAVTDGAHDFSEWAFFPGYALLIRLIHEVTTLPLMASMLGAAWLGGVLAVWAMYLLGDAFGGLGVARGSALLLAAWPGSAAFTFPYSEGLFIAGAAGSMACLLRRRWVAAGVLGAVATATRPTGLALVAAAAVVAIIELVRHRDWRPLVTPVIAAAGAAAFVVFAWLRTGDPMMWRHAENLWGQQLDFSAMLVRNFWKLLTNDTTITASARQIQLAGSWAEVFAFLGLLAMVVALWTQRRRASIGLVVYALVTTYMIVAYSAVAPRPRTVMAVLPGFVWLAAWLPRRALVAVAAVLATGLGVLAWLWLWAVIP